MIGTAIAAPIDSTSSRPKRCQKRLSGSDGQKERQQHILLSLLCFGALCLAEAFITPSNQS